MTRAPRPHLHWLDYGRFLAALSVVLFHYLVQGPLDGRMPPLDAPLGLPRLAGYGYLGVDFFFLISGFVIMVSAEGATARGFAIARFVRLWPTFVLCMTMTAATLVLLPQPGLEVTGPQYLANLTMVSNYLGFPLMDGAYWTLAYELTFYAMVLCIIALGLLRHAEALVMGWLVLIMASSLAGVDLPGLTESFALFAAGGLFFFVWRDGPSPRRLVPLGATLAFCAWAAATRALAMEVGPLSGWVAGAVTGVFFGVFLLFTTTWAGGVRLPGARTIGLMTYPIYLLHSRIGYALLSEVSPERTSWAALLGVLAVLLALSYAVVRYWELPYKGAWVRLMNRLLREPAAAVPARSA